MKIKSFFGDYDLIYDLYDKYIDDSKFYIISSTIKKLYNISPKNSIFIDDPESSKEYVAIADVISKLIGMKMKRKDVLVGIGGGAIQDITGFTATVLFRGVKWELIPTTLMSQTDSCIGSKTSINFGMVKNQVGSFYPPTRIIADTRFLDSLPKIEIDSGMGEIVKCHLLDGRTSLVSTDLDKLIHFAIGIKKYFIENDEFDDNIRNYLNYGHTFGHAIEGASNHGIVHGLGVILGMDISNFIAYRCGLIGDNTYSKILLFLDQFLPVMPDVKSVENVISFLKLDKKNVSDDSLTLIITDDSLKPKSVQVHYSLVVKYFNEYLKDERLK